MSENQQDLKFFACEVCCSGRCQNVSRSLIIATGLTVFPLIVDIHESRVSLEEIYLNRSHLRYLYPSGNELYGSEVERRTLSFSCTLDRTALCVQKMGKIYDLYDTHCIFVL